VSGVDRRVELRVCFRFWVGADSRVGELQVRSHLLPGHKTSSADFLHTPRTGQEAPYCFRVQVARSS